MVSFFRAFFMENQMSKVRSIFILLIFVLAGSAFAEYNRMGVPDSDTIRESIASAWFYPSLKNLRGKKAEVRTNSIGQKFQIRLEESESTFSVVVAPEVTLSFSVVSDGVEGKQTVSEYAADACGSWILTRDSITGKPKSIKYYFAKDGDVFVQFSPDTYAGKKTLADYVIGGCYAARSVPVGVSMESLYTASFNRILTITEKTLPWRYVEIYPGQYENKKSMIAKIKKVLSKIKYEKDGAYNEFGDPVYASSGSPRAVDDADMNYLTVDSNGFVKWVVDGLINPISGSGTLVAPLLRKTVSVSPMGHAHAIDDKDDLNFSLDWTRNLAAARLSSQTRKKYMYEESGVDVSITPFCAEMTSRGIENLTGYIPNSGYRSEFLAQTLYVLAATEPTYFYLAAIRTRHPSGTKNGNKTEYHSFDDSAVIFPYFDESGRFSCTVFESGVEYSLGSFLSKHGDCYVHLTRVLSSDRFFPQ